MSLNHCEINITTNAGDFRVNTAQEAYREFDTE